MQIKHFTAQKSLEIALKCVQKDVKNASKMWFRNGTNNNNTSSHMLLDHCYAFGLSLLPSSLWLFEEGDPRDIQSNLFSRTTLGKLQNLNVPSPYNIVSLKLLEPSAQVSYKGDKLN